MSQANFEPEKAIRLLDIMYDLYGDAKEYPNQTLLF